MEIVVTGRNVEVPDHFRVHVEEKLARLERYDHKIVGMGVELFHEPNRRQSKSCQRVEITGRGCGSVARAEACAQDFYGALDAAIAKLESRLRRSHDRRRVTGRRTRTAVARNDAEAESSLSAVALLDRAVGATGNIPDVESLVPEPRSHDEHLDATGSHDVPEDMDTPEHPGRIVRQKTHTAKPMSVDEALSYMELVGHDFYLFSDADCGAPSVVYRRKGYDYGVIRLGD